MYLSNETMEELRRKTTEEKLVMLSNKIKGSKTVRESFARSSTLRSVTHHIIIIHTHVILHIYMWS